MGTSPAVRLALGLAAGLAAGVAGTAAMSASQTAEMALSGRRPSTTPAEAACVLLGIETRTDAQKQRFATQAHWGYGTIWGLGQLALRQIREPLRSAVYFLTVWSAGAALLTGLKLSPPPTEWSKHSLLADWMHHAIYAVAAGLTFQAIARIARRIRRD
ncbi:MAG TPA: hypothetical protein VGL35_14660 [Rhizomicrobium sp.]|jgi:hypothetical protein